MTLNSDVFYEQINEDWRQGDIVLNIDPRLPRSNVGILCTPQCDIYHNKVDFFYSYWLLIFVMHSEKLLTPKTLF